MNEGTTRNIDVKITSPLIVPISIKGLGPFGIQPYLITLDVGSTYSNFAISSPKGQTGEFIINWKLFGDL
jgi:hypothetical protein